MIKKTQWTRQINKLAGFAITALLPLTALGEAVAKRPVLADIEALKKVGARLVATHPETGVGFAHITPQQESQLSVLAHEAGRCGGFEALPPHLHKGKPRTYNSLDIFGRLSERESTNRKFERSFVPFTDVKFKSEIESALNQVSESNLRATVEMLSSYTTRLHNGPQANDAVRALKTHVEAVLKNARVPFEVELVTHTSTPQNSLRVRIPGAKRPSEILVLGAHLDSINQEWFGSGHAPGADDNASGSSNLVEALRILSLQSQPERTIEFMWYAGEEGGLLGSSEIARSYKSEGRDVIAVLQLDMTLHPGDGEFTLGSMTDFTSAWLRAYFESLNSLYIKARIVPDRCGYGCSDHASWHRQGYPALMPFEASFSRMNKYLHTTKDIINSQSSFRHSAMFSKIALAIALDLGNSDLRETR